MKWLLAALLIWAAWRYLKPSGKRRMTAAEEDVRDVLGPERGWSEGAGAVNNVNVLPAYVDRLMQGYDGDAYRIGWDCSNGASGPVVEALTLRLPGEHRLLFTAVDDDFPNQHPDPSQEANLAGLRTLVVSEQLDFSIAFNGDGNEIGVVDAKGRVLWGDQILMLLADPVLVKLPGTTTIDNVKPSQALFDRVATLGSRTVIARTRHSLIKAIMADRCAAHARASY